MYFDTFYKNYFEKCLIDILHLCINIINKKTTLETLTSDKVAFLCDFILLDNPLRAVAFCALIVYLLHGKSIPYGCISLEIDGGGGGGVRTELPAGHLSPTSTIAPQHMYHIISLDFTYTPMLQSPKRGDIMRTGRPTLDRKGTSINLRLNEELKDYLEHMALINGTSVSEYIRQLIQNDMENK